MCLCVAFLGFTSAWIAFGALPLQAQGGRVATIVGVGTRGTAKDGDAVETPQINNPYGVIEDAARTGLYWVDNSTHRILKPSAPKIIRLRRNIPT